MNRDPATPPWDFLHDASISCLESYELSRLNHVANLRRQMGALLDQWIEDAAHALLARWILDDRALLRPSASALPQANLPFATPPKTADDLDRSETAPKLRKPRAIVSP